MGRTAMTGLVTTGQSRAAFVRAAVVGGGGGGASAAASSSAAAGLCSRAPVVREDTADVVCCRAGPARARAGRPAPPPGRRHWEARDSSRASSRSPHCRPPVAAIAFSIAHTHTVRVQPSGPARATQRPRCSLMEISLAQANNTVLAAQRTHTHTHLDRGPPMRAGLALHEQGPPASHTHTPIAHVSFG